jgi:hypothetical protein
MFSKKPKYIKLIIKSIYFKHIVKSIVFLVKLLSNIQLIKTSFQEKYELIST